MELALGPFGDERLEKGGPFCMSAWSRMAARGSACEGLGAIARARCGSADFSTIPKVTVEEMMATARGRACAQVAGRHVLAIQDTSALRVDEKGLGLSFHPVIAVDASEGTVLGLVEAFFLTRQGGERGKRKQKPFEEKDSRRWLEGAQAASALAEAGAACVTVK